MIKSCTTGERFSVGDLVRYRESFRVSQREFEGVIMVIVEEMYLINNLYCGLVKCVLGTEVITPHVDWLEKV